MSKLKRLAGETVLYGLGSIIPRFLNFLLVPLHTSVFLPEDYGVITKLLAYVGVINTVYMFGMETAYFRFANKPEASEKKIFNLTQTVVIAISGILSVMLILMAYPLAGKLGVSGRSDLVIWLVIIMFVDAVVAIPFARLRLQKKAMKFAIGKIINVGILVALNVYFLKMGPRNLPDVGFVFLANLIANSFYLFYLGRTLLSWRPTFDPEISPQVIRYAYPIMLTGLAGLTNEMFSRLTLDAWLPKNFYPGKSAKYVMGVFGACYKFAVLMNLAITAFRYAAEPFFFSNARDKNSPALFARVNHYFVIICCIFLLAVSINLDILKYFLTQPAYWEGLHIVPILLLAYLFLGMYYNFSIWFKLGDKTYYGTLITIGGAIITIAANYVLIPHYGYDGSAWAALLCYVSMAFLCYLLGRKFYPIPYDIGKTMLYILVTMALVYLVSPIQGSQEYFHAPNQVMAIAFHQLILGVYVAIVYFLERRGLRGGQA